MLRRCLILVACFLSLFCGSRAYAAEMYCVQGVGDTDPPWNGGTCSEIYIEGEIVAGDYQRFRDLLHFAEPWALSVILNSPGGNVAEALAIGRLIRERLLITSALIAVPQSIYCIQQLVNEISAQAENAYAPRPASLFGWAV